MAISTKYLLKWTTFHLKLYANSVLVSSFNLYKLSLQNGLLPAVDQTQLMAAYGEFKT